MDLRGNKLIATIYYAFSTIRQKCSYISGKENEVIVSGVKIFSCLQISGKHNKVEIHKRGKLIKSHIHIYGNNNHITIHPDAYVSGVELWIEGNDCSIEIMDGSFFGHHTHLACTENDNRILIGKNSMVSSYVQIRTGDSHSILDSDGKRINPAASVLIDDHCWIGEGAKILKGVKLGKNTIVATGAVVTKSFDSNKLIGGVPAQIIKDNVSWESKRI